MTDMRHITHPAKHLIRHVSKTGYPVLFTTPPWTTAQRDAAMARGPHKSAFEYAEFLRDELADMVERATWMVLPYNRLRELRHMRISPMGVVPQHERRPRPIVDYTYSGVNDDTVPLSPQEAMQFGRALERTIAQVVHSNPKFGPVQFLKIDIADGFYRVWLRLEDVPKLAVAIPSPPGDATGPLVALPLSLPMGWTQSPPAFCAVTETIADVANARLRHHTKSTRHRLDALADTPAPEVVPRHPHQLLPPPYPSHTTSTAAPDSPPTFKLHRRPLQIVDVFVDDFIGAAQGGRRRLQHVRRILMRAIDDVFRPLEPGDPVHRTEPISVKKLLKGDASWSTCKTILGWIIDSVAMTVTLPPRRLQRLGELLASIPPTQRRLSLDKWHQLLGELRSMALALPGARGLFSHLQAALRTNHDHRVRLTTGFHNALHDFRWIHTNLHGRPTRLYELVPTHPILEGMHDASRDGAGGVWIPQPSAVGRAVKASVAESDGTYHRPTLRTVGPIVWRCPFPPPITSQLVSWENPLGTINNSELELLGSFWHHDVAAHCFDVRERTLLSRTDNLATLYWARRGSVTTTSPTATLLRQQALHQRHHRYIGLKDYIPGHANTMADEASRLFHLDDRAFLTHFNLHHPQTQPWRLYRLNPNTRLSGISALHTKMSTTASFLQTPKPPLPTGRTGTRSVKPYGWILPYKTSPTQSPSSKSSPTVIDTVTLTRADAPSAVAPLKVPYEALVKRSRVWGPRTRVTPSKGNLTSASSAC